MKKQGNTHNSQKICYSITGMVNATDFSRSFIFEAIKNKRIKTFLRGHRRFILHDELERFVGSLAGGQQHD